ncbi:MAG: hypothetical protein JJ895_07765 [Balneolaceae bacterium]|nr:hypothetical protein [Balneolaceae bacterium]
MKGGESLVEIFEEQTIIDQQLEIESITYILYENDLYKDAYVSLIDTSKSLFNKNCIEFVSQIFNPIKNQQNSTSVYLPLNTSYFVIIKATEIYSDDFVQKDGLFTVPIETALKASLWSVDETEYWSATIKHQTLKTKNSSTIGIESANLIYDQITKYFYSEKNCMTQY